MRTEQEIFIARFEAIETEIPFNTAWVNGTGYFSFAVHGLQAVELKPGMVAKCTAKDSRKMIFIGTRLGPIVLFERYGNRRDVHVLNTTLAITRLQIHDMSGQVDKSLMFRLIGDPDHTEPDNFGLMLERVITAVAQKQQDAQS